MERDLLARVAHLQQARTASGDWRSNEAWRFAQALLGKPIYDAPESDDGIGPELRQWLADVSTLHEAWDASKHPRRGGSPNAGWFASTGGTGGGGFSTGSASKSAAVDSNELQDFVRQLKGEGRPSVAQLVARPKATTGAASGNANTLLAAHSKPGGKGPASKGSAASDPSRWYLPADDKGTWIGKKGHGTFRLKTPIDVDGKLIREIKYVEGIPVLDGFALPGKTATIVLTGDRQTDADNAIKAWKKANPGKQLPPFSTFHHDLLHVTEETVTIKGKKTKILVGKMPLIPRDLNRLVYHEGSASVTRKFYNAMNVDVAAVKEFARQQAPLIGKADRFVTKAAKSIVPGKITKSIRAFVGRNVLRAIPIVGTGLAILEFSENVEAHGIAGAVARSVPVLGDLIAAHDFGSELAKQITDEANAALGAAYQAANGPIAEAWKEASEQTIRAFNDLAPQIQVTNAPGYDGRVDPQAISDALSIFRQEMQSLNYKRSRSSAGFNYNAEAARVKQELKKRLIEACQKRTVQPPGPTL